MWKDVKHRKRKLLALIIVISLVVFIYYTLNMKSYAWYANRKKLVGDSGHRCRTPEWEMTELRKLAQDMHDILNELKLKHFLIYGRYDFLSLQQ